MTVVQNDYCKSEWQKTLRQQLAHFYYNEMFPWSDYKMVMKECQAKKGLRYGRGGRIRTADLLNPIQAR